MNRIEACQKLHAVALAELGVHETPGPAATARIMEYERHTDRGYTGSDEEAWCAKFANFVVDTAQIPVTLEMTQSAGGIYSFVKNGLIVGTHHANARSFLTWGVPLYAPVLGCIVIMRRGSSTTQGHVTFCDHPDISNGVIRCLGGNQGDAVKVSRFPVENVIGYRSPV